MTNTERDAINRRFAGLCGIEPEKIHFGTAYPLTIDKYPDFILHPTLVLVEMMKIGKLKEFLVNIFSFDRGSFPYKFDFCIDVDYILDTTEGLLAKAAIEFLEKEEGK